MANVNIQLGHKDSAWFTANPTKILLDGQIVYLAQTGTYKIGDGVTQLSALSFLGGNAQVNSDWNATSGVAQILNKPSIPSIAGLATVTYVDTQDALKVDKVIGKGLSTNDYTTAEQTKLAGIATGAEVNVNADWNATTGDSQILNKPSIPAAQIQSDWNQTNNASLDYIKNKPTVGTGDMLKSTYDTDNTGIVDNAEAIKIIGRNSTGVTLYRGTVVYLNGSTGNRPNFAKAKADAESTSAGTFGVIVDDIANNADGYCIALGYLDNLDTRSSATNPFTSDTLAAGDTIYLSPTTAGYITNVKPSAPNHLVYLGKVTRTSPTNGTIVYRIQNGYELDELHNVQAQSPTNKDTIYFDSADSQWKTASISTILGYTPEALSNKVTTFATLNNNLYPTTLAVSNLVATKQDTLVSGTNIKTVNSTSLLGSGNISVGTVTSVAALTLGTTGTDVSSTVATGTTTPVITFNLPTASATNRGALSSTDWSTFNGKQNALGFTPVTNARTITINGTTYDLTADRTWTISAGSNLAIKDEGTTLTSAATSIDFTGAGVTASVVGTAVTVNVSGIGASTNLFNYYNFI